MTALISWNKTITGNGCEQICKQEA